MKKFIFYIVLCLFSVSGFAKSQRQTVVFDVPIHCQGCITKIEKNIAFEKGVKDLICDLKKKQVTVVFDPAKTDIPTLQQAFQKIGKPATVHSQEQSPSAGTKHQSANTPEPDTTSGASNPAH